MPGFINIQFKTLVKKIQCIIVFFYTACFTLTSFSLEQYSKQWFGFNGQQPVGNHQQWLVYVFSQLRFVDQAHPLQAMVIEPAVGSLFSPDLTAWIGYRWTGRNPYNDFFQENRLFEQIISQKRIDPYRFIFRNRLEEITHSNNSEIALRLRERVSLEIKKGWFNSALPFFYDEVFFELNRTSYQPENFIGENRLFLGFNVYVNPKAWWEIGYINQFVVKTPQQTQNQMNHIASFTYNFV